MSIKMPAPDQTVLDRRDRIVRALRAIVPGEGVIAAESEMRPYESDALTAYRQLPMVVVLPDTVDQVCRVLKYCNAEGIKVVPRGAGTSLSGGALPASDGVVLGMAKFNRIREIDLENRGSTMHPTHPRRSPARSAATWRRIPAACIASNTASPATMCWVSKSP